MRIADEDRARPPAGPPSREEREATVDRLCAHFARDALTESELERRLDLAYAAKTRAELASLERDLPILESGTRAGGARSPVPIDPGRAVHGRDLVVSIWGGTERKGAWTVRRRLATLNVMGGSELDFREAVFTTRDVSLRVVAVMGGVQIIVPPGVGVEWAGVALMGGVSMPERSGQPAPDGPVVRISGLVFMGGVEVVERLPGESAREARKRLRREKKRARQRRDSRTRPGRMF